MLNQYQQKRLEALKVKNIDELCDKLNIYQTERCFLLSSLNRKEKDLKELNTKFEVLLKKVKDFEDSSSMIGELIIRDLNSFIDKVRKTVKVRKETREYLEREIKKCYSAIYNYEEIRNDE